MPSIEDMFTRKADLFLKVMTSEKMMKRGEEEAEALRKLLVKYGVPEGSKVLEVGCGSGRVAIPLAKIDYKVYGIDFSKVFLDYALNKSVEEGVEAYFHLRDLRRGFKDLFREGFFDAAYLIWTTIFGYYDEEEETKILRDIYEVVKKGGVFIIANTMHRDAVAFRNSVFRGSVYDEYKDIAVIDIPSFDPVKSIIRSEWRFYKRRGMELEYIDNVEFELRVYTLKEIIEMVESVGWKLAELYGDIRTLASFKPALSGLNAVFTK
jgi:ubiquinone/menaquinone biosynthesis C-methylase UbiE